MECHHCRKPKLSYEFPHRWATTSCAHPPLNCLRCLVEHLGKRKGVATCLIGCVLTLPEVDGLRKMYASMYPSPAFDEPLQQQLASSLQGSGQVVKVVMLNGDEHQVPYMGNMSIDQLKAQLYTTTRVVAGKQKLLFQGQELVPVVDSQVRSLADYRVGPGATLHLLVMLYEFRNSDINKVIFELNWTFPGSATDFLDGSCLFYQGEAFVGIVDYSAHQAAGILHSGDVMTTVSGHHDMRIQLDAIPKLIDRLFFALSAYNCGNLSLFRNPSVKVYDERQPTKQLCQYAISSAGSSSAVIMCCLYRSSGGWEVSAVGRHSGGTVRDYGQMKHTCLQLIRAQTS